MDYNKTFKQDHNNFTISSEIDPIQTYFHKFYHAPCGVLYKNIFSAHGIFLCKLCNLHTL